ncbi:MAG TPA: hypothetical protein VGH98_20165 [Gemmatimonadaceae bacterium]
MRISFSVMIAGIALSALACDSPFQPAARAANVLPGTSLSAASNDVVALATGGGHYLLAATYDARFAFSASAKADGSASGEFHQFVQFETGTFDVTGEVTCLTVDPANGRAWIGGKVKENRSTDPDYIVPITAPGQDVWFRVLDAGEGGASVDRTTFYGFVGSFASSAEYCAAQSWPADNARTYPVTAGNIQVR